MPQSISSRPEDLSLLVQSGENISLKDNRGRTEYEFEIITRSESNLINIHAKIWKHRYIDEKKSLPKAEFDDLLDKAAKIELTNAEVKQ